MSNANVPGKECYLKSFTIVTTLLVLNFQYANYMVLAEVSVTLTEPFKLNNQGTFSFLL